MTAKPNDGTTAAPAAETISSEPSSGAMPEGLAQAAEQDLRPEQLLACIGLGWMERLQDGGAPWGRLWEERETGRSDLASLRQRLEVIQLAVQTGAPLTTAEVTTLLGARPGADLVERAGLRARRISRNVWKLSRSSEGRDTSSSVVAFSEGFRRRL
jgi:hypothetical protein